MPRASADYNLATENPELAQEWHPTKNGELTPEQVTPGSSKKVWWYCANGHTWQSQVVSRNKGAGCPLCSGRFASEQNNIVTTDPELAAEWHPDKNGDFTPAQVSSGSGKKVWWRCARGHEWEASVSNRSKGRGCPFCSGKKVAPDASLAALYPDLARDWDASRNKELPEYVSPGSHKRAWWQCGRGHTWEASIRHRANGIGCPFCSNKATGYGNSLLSLFPDLAAEWHPSKNIDLQPDGFTPGSGRKVWWQCAEGHEWEARICNRSGLKHGCPVCREGYWDVATLRYFVESLLPFVDSMDPAELYAICRQKGIFNMTGKGAKLGEKIGTGKIPKEEFEKFAEGKPSELDKYLDQEGRLLGPGGQALDEEAIKALSPEELEELQAAQAGLSGLADSDIPTEQAWVDSQLDGDSADPTSAEADPASDSGKPSDDDKLPQVSAGNALQAVNGLTALVDQEVAEYLVASALHKIWKHAFRDEKKALEEVEAYKGEEDSYGARVKSEFLTQYEAAKEMKIPKGYSFKGPDGKRIEPNLMQRLVASRVRDEKRIGNWSGTGAGKTLSAILASRVSDCRLNIVCCPNSVVAGWARTIQEVFPDSEVQTKDLKTPAGAKGRRRAKNKPPLWIVVNYETFQQPGAPDQLRELLDGPLIDMVVIDEIHYTKQRSADKMSLRKQMVAALLSGAAEKNPDLHVLGMSATPVINNLQEGKSLVEMVDGLEHEELITRATVPNAMALHQALSRLGLRWMPEYDPEYERIEVEVDCSELVDELKSDSASSPMAMERILTEARLPVIRDWVQPKTLIYTHYIGGRDGTIEQLLVDALKEDGWSVGLYTGDDKSGLDRFINGDLDVLIGTSAIGTGVDGLQQVCSRLIFNALPWTNAEFEQIKGRIYRQGQGAEKVEIVIPKTHAKVNGEDWSWCEVKLKRLENKKTIADCAVDGVVPEEQLVSPEVATRRIKEWLRRLDEGKVGTIERPRLEVPLPPPSDRQEEKRRAAYGDFSKMNASWNRSKSGSTHDRLAKDPTEWQQYHTLYREAREGWSVVPYEELTAWCKTRGPDKVIGDFGCGEALIAEELVPEGYTVYSFDHVAINDNVIACDVSEGVPLEDGQLNTAIFSLSLMGSNFTDYLREAHRCLAVDGSLWVVEATSRFSDVDGFCDGLHKLGFDMVGDPEERGQFTFIRALRSGREPQADLKLKF